MKVILVGSLGRMGAHVKTALNKSEHKVVANVDIGYENCEGYKSISDVKEDGTAEEFYNSLVEKGFANGNCIVISTNPVCLSEICEIIKNA